jgi:hypothetical protein
MTLQMPHCAGKIAESINTIANIGFVLNPSCTFE